MPFCEIESDRFGSRRLQFRHRKGIDELEALAVSLQPADFSRCVAVLILRLFPVSYALLFG
jgi:hypothetical protein